MRSAFANLLAAEVVSNFGAMLSRVAIPWLATLVLDVTPFQMAFLLVADIAAGAAGSLFLGVAVDRRDKRAVMLAMDIVRALVIGSLAALAALERLSFAMLVAAAAVSAIATVTFELARSAWIAQGIAPADLAARNAQMSMGASLAETFAFALGGWLYQALGAVFALAADAVTYLLSAAFVRGVPKSGTHAPAAPGNNLRAMWADVRVGSRAIAATPVLRTLAGVEMLVALGMSFAGTSYMIYVARDLGFETGILGMIFATGGIGAVAGAALAPRLGRRWGWRGAMLFGLAALTLGAFCIPLAQAATVFGAILLVSHQVIGDGGYAVYDVHDRTLRQTAVGPDLLARVDAGIRTLGHLARLAGALGGGVLASFLGTRAALTLAALFFGAALVVVLLSTRPTR